MMQKTMEKRAVSPAEPRPLLSSHGMKSCPKCAFNCAWQIPRPFWMHFLPGMVQIQCGHCRQRFWRFR
jgi:hypothetical protein